MAKRITNRELLEGLTQQLDVMADNMTTKDDLKGFATKDDLRGLATKDDLKGFATKDDLKNLATKDDLERVAVRLERKIDSNQAANINHHLETREDIGKLHQEVGDLREGLAHAAGLN